MLKDLVRSAEVGFTKHMPYLTPLYRSKFTQPPTTCLWKGLTARPETARSHSAPRAGEWNRTYNTETQGLAAAW